VRPTSPLVIHIGCKGYLQKIQKNILICFLNSPEGSPEGAINNDVASEIGSSTPLEESILPVNPLLSVARDPLFLRINSSGDVVVEDYNRIPTGPHTEFGVDDPPF
jgi:hypothetical protein